MGVPVYTPYAVFDRVFDAIGRPDDLRAPITVRELTERFSKACGVDSCAEIEISRVPSTKEIRAAAVLDVIRALEQIGIHTSREIDFNAPAESVFPRTDRQSKWDELGRLLDVKLPMLEPSKWKLSAISWIGTLACCLCMCGLGLVVAWIGEQAARVDEPSTILGTILGCIAGVVVFFMVIVVFVASIVPLLWIVDKLKLLHLQDMPIQTLQDLVGRVAESKHEKYIAFLRRTEQVVVSHFIRQVVAEEYDLPIDRIVDEFRIW